MSAPAQPSLEVLARDFFTQGRKTGKNLPVKDYPVVVITNKKDFATEIKWPTKYSDSIFAPNARMTNFKVEPSFALNLLLYYMTSRNFIDEKKYKINGRAWLEAISWCHFSQLPADKIYFYMAVGNAYATPSGLMYSVISMVSNFGNPAQSNAILAMAVTWEHPDFKKTIAICRATDRTKTTNLMLKTETLQIYQKKYKNMLKQWLDPQYANPPREKALNYIANQDDKLGLNETSISADEEEELLNTSNNNNTNNANIDETSFDNEADMSDYLPPAPGDISIIAPVENHLVDETLMDEELVENLNNNNVLTSLLEPESNQSNVSLLSSETLSKAESRVLEEEVYKEVRSHHERNANSIDEEHYNASFLRKLTREENRAKVRQRSGRGYNPNSETTDLREAPGVKPEDRPAKSFTNQDDDYLDYAFYGYIREYGTVVNDIMKLPYGLNYNSQRRGNNVYIRAIHFKNTFTHITGTKAGGRMVIFYTNRDGSYKNLLGIRTWNSVEPHDILQKSVTMYAGDLEDLEAADVFYNPTILSPYDFRNVMLGNKYKILWDYYVDLNTEAVKGLVGEDIESVDNMKTKWVKIDNLDLPFFYDNDEKVATRGQLGILFMGDYFGGEIETNCVMRIFYNSK